LGGVQRFKDKEVFIDADRLWKLADEIEDVGIKGVELTGFYGEPLANPATEEFAQKLINGHKVKVGLITNGDLLGKLGDVKYNLSYIRVSMSSLKDSVHKKVRGGHTKVENILNSLKEVNDGHIVSGPVTGIGFTIDTYNYKEVYDLCTQAYYIGCDNVRLTPVWKNDMKYWKKLHKDVIGQIAKFRKDYGNELVIIGPETYVKNYTIAKKYQTCYYSNLTMNMTSDGECYPCCVTRGVKGWAFGNIYKQSLDEIVWGLPRRKLIKSINPNSCPSCIWDNKNEFLEYVVEGGEHAEFV
jgi:radical SAM protein with 4Fe4S-binding SPASM domain